MSNFRCICKVFMQLFFRQRANFCSVRDYKRFISSYTLRICTAYFAWFFNVSQYFWKNNRVEISVKKYLPHIPHEFAFTIFLVFTAFLSDIFSDILHFQNTKVILSIYRTNLHSPYSLYLQRFQRIFSPDILHFLYIKISSLIYHTLSHIEFLLYLKGLQKIFFPDILQISMNFYRNEACCTDTIFHACVNLFLII
mgnify:CR=1 FL=1